MATIDVYCDGACLNNGFDGAKAGIGVWFGFNHKNNVSAPVWGPPTNNNAEIQAATRAIEESINMGYSKVNIITDSEFLINAATKWMRNWKRNGWRTANGQPVRNEAAFRALDAAMAEMHKVFFEFVPAHSGHEGNEQADRLARAGAKRYCP